MAMFEIRDGSVSMTMDDKLDRMVRGAVERVYPGALDRMEKDAQEVMDAAKKRWPKGRDRKPKRAHSRDLFYLDTRVSGDLSTLKVHIRNRADYAKFIKPRFLWGKSAVVEFLRKPIRKRAKRLVKDLGKLIKGDLVRV